MNFYSKLSKIFSLLVLIAVLNVCASENANLINRHFAKEYFTNLGDQPIETSLADKRNKNGNTLLHLIFTIRSNSQNQIRFDRVAVAKKLLESKLFDINKKNNGGKTPLYFACSRLAIFPEIKEIIPMMLEAGAALNERDNSNKTPIFYFTICSGYRTNNEEEELSNFESIATILIEKGADLVKEDFNMENFNLSGNKSRKKAGFLLNFQRN